MLLPPRPCISIYDEREDGVHKGSCVQRSVFRVSRSKEENCAIVSSSADRALLKAIGISPPRVNNLFVILITP